MRPIELILTASSRAQARGYLHELQQRRRDGLLECASRMMVVPDPGGRRAGSGTATLLAIDSLVRRIRRERGDDSLSIDHALNGRRVLIIHSGGDSRRLPAYAAQGKIFTPLPCEDRPPQARTLFDLILDDLASIEWPAEGGVLIASGDVLLGVARHSLRFDDRDVQCVASPGDLLRASRHGVFIADDDGVVLDVLQKPSAAALKASAMRAVDGDGRALIDLGLVFLPLHETGRWVRLAAESDVLSVPASAIDLYSQMLPAAARSRRIAAMHDARGASFLGSLAGGDLRVRVLPDTLFFHVGSTRELLSQTTDRKTLRKIGCSCGDSHEQVSVQASIIAARSTINGPAFVESSWLTRSAVLRGDNVLVGVPRECDASIHLPPSTGLVCLPIDRHDWAAVGFGVDDDFKTAVTDGGTFAGIALASFNASHWNPRDDRTLWSARLWRIANATESVAHALAMLKNPSSVAQLSSLASAAQIMSRVNHRRLLEHRRIAVREAAFTAVALRVRSHVALPTTPRVATIERALIVRATAPVRIDLAGGWSDTPPICHDVGGAVVNVAVRLDSAKPIRAEARLIDEPLIRIRSLDLHKSIDLRDSAALCAHGDPADWAALPKAALILAGIAPSNPADDLAAWLKNVGGGVELTISSDLPKGSGLGTSSILGATTLACLARLVGESPASEALIARTSALEQMMSTAGGWQDQAGGITPGAKLLTTAPGANQIPIEQPLPIPADFWRERVLLYSTGLQRLARGILQNVVWRWLSRSPETRTIVDRLRAGAHAMRDHLLAGDCESFARGVLEYWELKKAIDPGATTPAIEALIERVRPHLSAWELPGAGGGGFLFMIAQNQAAAARVRDLLSAHPLNPQAHFYEPTIDDSGIDCRVVAPTQT